MALNWDFKRKAGTVTQNIGKEDITLNWYEGNALMIVTNEWKEEKTGEELYSMAWFFIGDDHAKNCLGLSKGHTNMFEDHPITKLTIYRDHCRQWLNIVKYFTKAFPDIEITISSHESESSPET